MKNFESFYYKKELNPKVWKDFKLDEHLREKLLVIANEFYDTFKFTTKLEDVLFTGSLCNFNWNKYSDFDLHILLDMSKINPNLELVKSYCVSNGSMWNLKHNIYIRGHEVECYLQDVNEPHIATGVYSILNNEWLRKPKYNEPEINEEHITFKYNTIVSGIDILDKLAKEDLSNEDALINYNCANGLKNKIKTMRKQELEKDGEFSVGNLVFKRLRNNDDMERLMKSIDVFYDKIYSQK